MHIYVIHNICIYRLLDRRRLKISKKMVKGNDKSSTIAPLVKQVILVFLCDNWVAANFMGEYHTVTNN